MTPVVLVSASTKEQIVLVAEQLFSQHGLNGVSLRQIGAAAGNGNHSAVQYHFGSKAELVEAIFDYRLSSITERRRILTASRQPTDLRACVECYVLPILEQGEQRGSNYLSFVAMLQQSRDRYLFGRIPDRFRVPVLAFRQEMADLLAEIPEPLRSHRVMQAVTFSVHASADRERQQGQDLAVLPFAVHVIDLLDGLVGFLTAPVSANAIAALGDTEPAVITWPLLF
jgi:AcrR family transcriptional regulator